MSSKKYLEMFEDHPGKMTDTYSHLGSSHADPVAYGVHEISGMTVEQLRQFTCGHTDTIGSNMANEDALYRGKVFEAPNVLMTIRYLCKFTDIDNISSEYPVMEPDVYEGLRMASSVDHKLYFKKPVNIPIPGTKNEFVTMQGQVINELKSSMNSSGDCMRNYISQTQHQLVCTNGEFALISVLSKNGQLTVYPMVRDDAWIADYLREVQEYWRRVDEDEPYPEAITNDFVADLDEMEEADTFIDLLDKRQEFEGKVKSFEDSRKEIDTAIKTMLDNLGVKKCTVGPYKISYTTVERKPQPERVVPAKPGSTYQKLTVSLNKEKLQ